MRRRENRFRIENSIPRLLGLLWPNASLLALCKVQCVHDCFELCVVCYTLSRSRDRNTATQHSIPCCHCIAITYTFSAGTIPTDSNSLFQILDQWVTSSNYIVCWLGSTNGSTNAYHMLCSTNLADAGAWTEVALVPKTPPATNYWTNAVSASPISYRIQVDAP